MLRDEHLERTDRDFVDERLARAIHNEGARSGGPFVTASCGAIPELAGNVIRRFRDELVRHRVNGITDDAMAAMLAWPWPGNVRELVNAVEHAMVLCEGSTIEIDVLPDRVARHATDRIRDGGEDPNRLELPAGWDDLPLVEAWEAAVERFERRSLDGALQRNRGRVGATARAVGLAPRSLYEKMRRHGLRKEDYRSSAETHAHSRVAAVPALR